MYYWYGNPYSLEVVLKDWNGNEEKDNTYRLIDKYIEDKEKYETLDVDVIFYLFDYEASIKLMFYNHKVSDTIKVDERNPKEEIESAIMRIYSNNVHIALSVIYNDIDNSNIKQDFLDVLNKFYHCTPDELKEILEKFDKRHKFIK